MTELFLQILNNSFSAVWVVLVVCAARLLLKKAPRSLVCGLWSLVGLRLILGGRLESPISLIPSAEIIPPASMYDRAPTIHSGLSSIDSAVNPIYSEVFKSDGFSSVNPLQVWTAVAANIWVIVAALILLWAVIGWLRIRQQVRESIPAEQGVFLCDRIDSPFILGLIRPKIYLPSNLDDSARDHVIAHERAHLRRLDHWWKPLGFALLTVNWFNPAMWLAYVLLCRDIEMSCDERVVRNLGMEEKKSYSNALLTCSSPRNLIAACPLAFGEVGVKQRIKSVLHYKKPALWVILISLALTAVLAACTLTDPIPTESVPTHTLPSLDTPSQNEETPLGIRLSAEHVTASGLTLVYTREGSAEDWVEIVTSPEWTLEKWVDGAWLDIMPENVGWDEVLYQVPMNGSASWTVDFERVLGKLEAGYYRIGKVFFGHPGPDAIKSTTQAAKQTCYAEFESNPLGITLSLDNVTPSGATLICTQDGALWDEIITGSPWSLQQWTGEGWISVMPEDTAWTSIAYLVNRDDVTRWNINWSLIVGDLGPGYYRVGKTFTGRRRPPATLGLEAESVQQTCYAEFIIE